MSAPVDVLAVLDRLVENICRNGGSPWDAMAARSALAELLEADASADAGAPKSPGGAQT